MSAGITPYDGPGRYLVEPSKPGDAYLVDICAHAGNGECSCPHFSFRLLPQLLADLANRRTSTPPARCIHILRARDEFTDEVISKLNAQAEPPTPTNRQ